MLYDIGFYPIKGRNFNLIFVVLFLHKLLLVNLYTKRFLIPVQL